jgi:hypothetical protein
MRLSSLWRWSPPDKESWRSTPFLNSLLFFLLALTAFLTLNVVIGLVLDLPKEPGIWSFYLRFLLPFWALVGGVAALRAWRRRQ